jgi:hypothetical protein
MNEVKGGVIWWLEITPPFLSERDEAMPCAFLFVAGKKKVRDSME